MYKYLLGYWLRVIFLQKKKKKEKKKKEKRRRRRLSVIELDIISFVVICYNCYQSKSLIMSFFKSTVSYIL